MMTSTLRILIKTSVKEGILANSSILLHSPNIQSVRFRKPRWVPLAKSKEFYVRKPTPIVKEEYDELKIRYRLYRSEVESIRLVFLCFLWFYCPIFIAYKQGSVVAPSLFDSYFDALISCTFRDEGGDCTNEHTCTFRWTY